MRRAGSAPGQAPRRRRSAATTRTRTLTTAVMLLVAGLATPLAAQGPGAPLDRTVVAIPPVYPTPAAGFLRLPETRSAPIPAARALPAPVAGGVVLAPREGDRPAWQPARLEAVPAIDARGRITSILEYTPGRFDR